MHRIIPAILLVIGTLFLGFGVDRTDFWQVLLGFSTAFLGYAFLVRNKTPLPQQGQPLYKSELVQLIGLGILLRLALLFAFPLLSDDIYRFIWDGQLIRAGLNPFAQLPGYYLAEEHAVAGLTPTLFAQLNSPDYYTIYPPVAQGVFTVAAYLSPHSWQGASIVMKLFLLMAELGSLALLWQLLPAWQQSRHKLLFYWLNPLIMVEIMGNLHFEGMMVCFLLLALAAFIRSRWVLAAGAFALSVASKLLPLMFLPFLVFRLWWRKKPSPFWVFSIAFGIITILLFIPLFSAGFTTGFGSSIDLYFRKFEFNASIYYLLRAYGYATIGWNQIAIYGPLLGKIAVGLIFGLALVQSLLLYSNKHSTSPESEPTPPSKLLAGRRWKNLPSWMLAAFTTYLLFATTVHPWYLSIPIVLCCFGNWRYPLIWSFFIVLTYTSYTTNPYTEYLALVGLEYGVVLIFLGYEVWRMLANRKPTAA